MTCPYRALLRMDIRAGAEVEFESEWRRIADATTTWPACRAQWLARDTVQESVYYVVADWVDEAAFRAFERSAEHVDNRRRLDRYRVNGDMDTMHVVASLQAVGPEAPLEPPSTPASSSDPTPST